MIVSLNARKMADNASGERLFNANLENLRQRFSDAVDRAAAASSASTSADILAG